MLNQLNILYPVPFYPGLNGGFLRTFNIAKIASLCFDRTNLIATDERCKYESTLHSLNLIQDLKYRNCLDKLSYFYEGLFSNSFSWRVPQKYLEEDSFFQIEEPLLYNALVKNDIKKYILDEHNVNWEIYNQPGVNLKEKIFKFLTKRRNKLIEKKALLNAEWVFVCSQRDKEVFIDNIPHLEEEKLVVIPNCVEYKKYEHYTNSNKRQNHAKNVVFIGTFTYYPNLDALRNICEIAESSDKDIQFKIVGSNPPEIDYPPNVKIMGYVDDVKREILDSDICIAPIRYGSGTRLKILEYMAMGKPVISTEKGAEGIEYTHKKDIIIENDISKYPMIIENLIDDEKTKKHLGKNAKRLIETKYNWKVYEKSLFKIYEDFIG